MGTMNIRENTFLSMGGLSKKRSSIGYIYSKTAEAAGTVDDSWCSAGSIASIDGNFNVSGGKRAMETKMRRQILTSSPSYHCSCQAGHIKKEIDKLQESGKTRFSKIGKTQGHWMKDA